MESYIKDSFTLSERESEFISLIFVATKCDWIHYEPIWIPCRFRFRTSINEPNTVVDLGLPRQ